MRYMIHPARTLLTVLLLVACFASGQKQQPLPQVTDAALRNAVNQYKYLRDHLPAGVLPKTFLATKKLETSNTSWWTSGFYPGSLLYLYEYSHDTALLNEARPKARIAGERTVQQRHARPWLYDVLQFRQCKPALAFQSIHGYPGEQREIIVNAVQSNGWLYPVVECQGQLEIPGDHRQHDEPGTAVLGNKVHR
jgi:hypothetical protein